MIRGTAKKTMMDFRYCPFHPLRTRPHRTRHSTRNNRLFGRRTAVHAFSIKVPTPGDKAHKSIYKGGDKCPLPPVTIVFGHVRAGARTIVRLEADNGERAPIGSDDMSKSLVRPPTPPLAKSVAKSLFWRRLINRRRVPCRNSSRVDRRRSFATIRSKSQGTMDCTCTKIIR